MAIATSGRSEAAGHGSRYAGARVLPFPLTRRSVIDRIRSGDAEARQLAFGTLAAGYWRPSYHYVRVRWHLPQEDAEDVVQAFFATAFEKRYVERFDPAKAKFRTFLRTCLDRFIQNDRKAERALKRGGGAAPLSLDFPGAERDLAEHLRAPAVDPDAFFREETIRGLFARTVEIMRSEFTAGGRARAFRAFERYDLAGETGASYATLAAELGLTVAQVTNDLYAARRRFREIALDQLRGLVGTDDEFRSEARDLFGFEVPD